MLESIGNAARTYSGFLLGLAADETPQIVGFPAVATIVLSLLLVAALAWATTRLVANRPFGGRNARSLRIVERVPIDRTHALLVISVEGRSLLVGLAPAGLSLIAELESTEAKEPGTLFHDEDARLQTPWMRWATALRDRIAAPAKPSREEQHHFHLPEEVPDEVFQQLTYRMNQRNERLDAKRKDDDPS